MFELNSSMQQDLQRLPNGGKWEHSLQSWLLSHLQITCCSAFKNIHQLWWQHMPILLTSELIVESFANILLLSVKVQECPAIRMATLHTPHAPPVTHFSLQSWLLSHSQISCCSASKNAQQLWWQCNTRQSLTSELIVESFANLMLLSVHMNAQQLWWRHRPIPIFG